MCDNDAISASCGDDFDLQEPLPCSFDDDTMCMKCIDLKYDRFVSLQQKNFGNVHTSSTSTNDASSLVVKNVENCEQLHSLSSVDKHDDFSFFESIEHDEEFISSSSQHSSFNNKCACDESCAICMEVDSWLSTPYDATSSSNSIDNIHVTLENGHENCLSFDLNSFLSIGRPNMGDSHVLNDKIVKNDEFFHLILSCDLPPDLGMHSSSILHKSSSSSTLIPPTSCDCKFDVVYPNTNLGSSPFRLQVQEDFKSKNVSFTPTNGSNVDFLGCDSYLESFDLKLLNTCSNPLQVCSFGLGISLGLFSLHEHHCRSHMKYPCQPPRKINKGEVGALKSNMIIIKDENFSFKHLKIP